MHHIEFSVNEAQNNISAHLDGQEFNLPALWLRERCQDPEHLDQVTEQRLFDPHQLMDELAITQIQQLDGNSIALSFSDGYSGHYNLDAFRADFDIWDGAPEAKPWVASTDKTPFYVEYSALETESGLIDALERFLTYGALILNNVPTETATVVNVAERFGNIRETNFGRYFDVFTRPDYIDLSGQSVPLGPHTDNPYRDPMPGIQMLHCIENQTSGGLSTLVDSLSVLQQLKEEDPEGYRLLSEVPVRYRHCDREIELIERRTMIQTDYMGKVTGVAYSPRLDYLPLLDQNDLVRFHKARKRLGQLFSDPRFEWRFRLEPGQLQMFHNTRVLHGRTGFDATEGMRRLQGAYIDLDAPKGRYKALKRKMALNTQESV